MSPAQRVERMRRANRRRLLPLPDANQRQWRYEWDYYARQAQR